ncbi:FecR family protein [Pedobacter sp. MC2016-24]|uniref:FecR family protein n=1 Tax=Pedobacter sp. MC2016-24 TaxID=2780090 RepID=UPI00187E4324|nr:FecR family protein [Pedobacter sp. MC2016-24]MBE9599267.1 FecR domain-containing protein [Pedobacter sp. MC2016-24]
MENKFAKSLLEKYIAGTCSEEECATVEAWYAQWNEGSAVLPEEKLELAMKRIQERLPTAQDESRTLTAHHKENYPVKINWISWAAAAAIILSTSFGIWFYNNNQLDKVSIAKNTGAKDILPGKNTAVLTLSNGKSIKLSDAKSGIVIDANQLSYNDGAVVDSSLRGVTTPQSHTNELLTATTPRGGQYQFTLPDGTRVWLNAASTLKFPSNFKSESTRTVKLIGEGYFEVAKDKSKPFIVETEQQQVKVLGTHFNVNSYSDEHSIKTTLLEGSVQLNAGTHQLTLKPGEQAALSGTKIDLQQVDTEDAIAWKNGIFVLNDEDLESIMRKVARWYDVEVYYQNKPPKMSFLGALSRSKNLSVLLKVLEESGQVHFKVEGRRITVMR